VSTILLTGFEAFGGSAVNPSAQLAAALAGATVGGFAIETMVLPVVTVEAGDRLDAAIDAIGPAFVVCCGEDGRAAEIRVERVAVNRREFGADNLGTACRDLPVVEGGPESLEATLPVERLVAASLAASVPAAPSDSAGTYLCNEIMYRVLHRGLVGRSSPQAGFVHVPRLPEQGPGRAGVPMPLERTLEGVRAMLAALAGEAASGNHAVRT